jgi:type I restriction enzyme S subunit
MKVTAFCKTIYSGGTPLRSEQSYWENAKIPWLKTGEIKKEYIYITEEYISEKGLANSSAKLVPKNSILIAMYGDGDTAGHVAINKIPLATNQACCNLVVNQNIAHYRYVYFLFKANYSNLINLKLGGSQQNLNATTIKALDFPLPPLPIQRKIAAVLSAYDDLIGNNNRRIAILEKMAEELYREWFVRLRFPGHENVKLVKGVPEGWEVKISSEVLDILGGGTPKTDVASYWDGEIPFFTPKDSHDGYFAYETEKKITGQGLHSCNSQYFKKGTIFITARGTVGNIVLALRPMAMNQSCYALMPKNGEYELFHFLALRDSVSVIKGTSNSGVFDNIITDSFKQFGYQIPTKEVLKKFDKLITPIFSEMESLFLANRSLSITRDRLLSRLMSGKLDVENLDIEFPASMKEELARS